MGDGVFAFLRGHFRIAPAQLLGMDEEDLTRQGLEMDAYFKMLEMDREKYIEENLEMIKEVAKKL